MVHSAERVVSQTVGGQLGSLALAICADLSYCGEGVALTGDPSSGLK